MGKESSRRYEFWQRMRELLPNDAECQEMAGALERFAENPPRALRLNRLRGATAAFVGDFGFRSLAPVPWEPQGFFAELSGVVDPSSHPVLGAGLLYLQEPGAMEAVSFLDPKPGEIILDLCAAPGAKSSQIGERLQGRGWLVSNDPVRGRAERLDALLARQGVLNGSVYALDPGTLAAIFPTTFDRILVDAPCSGESLFAKRHDLRRDVRDVDVTGCARRQFAILNFAADMLKPGGVLVYSTCTYSKEENEDVRASFLEARPEFSLIKEQRRWPHRDGVAGGYVARFELRGAVKTSATRLGAPSRVLDQSSGTDAKNVHGLLRHGPLRWNFEVDLYALAMSAVGGGFAPENIQFAAARNFLASPPQGLVDLIFSPRLTSDDEQARQYLRGNALPLPHSQKESRHWVKVLWKDYVIGVGKGVGDRVNNLLPRVLRASASPSV